MRTAQQVTIVLLIDQEGPVPQAELQAMAKAAAGEIEGYNRLVITAVAQKPVEHDA